jgi:hypothetical protein
MTEPNDQRPAVRQFIRDSVSRFRFGCSTDDSDLSESMRAEIPWQYTVTDQELHALALLATVEGKDGHAYRAAVAVLYFRGHYRTDLGL